MQFIKVFFLPVNVDKQRLPGKNTLKDRIDAGKVLVKIKQRVKFFVTQRLLNVRVCLQPFKI